MIIGIIAISRNFAIGKGGKLPWHFPADLRFFKETTMGNAVVMGSNTWHSIGRPLTGRLNVVLSRSGNVPTRSDVMRLNNRDEVIALSGLLNRDTYIIGGAKTFQNFTDVIERWVVTEVPLTVDDADTFMPENFLNEFDLLETKEIENNLKVKFLQRK